MAAPRFPPYLFWVVHPRHVQCQPGDIPHPPSRPVVADPAGPVDWHAVADALDAHVAVVAADGHVLAVNRAWRQFARENAGPAAGATGTNYLEVCRTSAAVGISEAESAFGGVRDVVLGRRDRFELEYPCHSPTEQRWFLMRVTPLRDEAPPRPVVVTHTNITARRRALLDEVAAREAAGHAREASRLSTLDREPATEDEGGATPGRPALDDALRALVPRYLALLDMMVEQRAYRVEYALGASADALAEQLAARRVRPRDLVALHRTAMAERLTEGDHGRSAAYLEEGRLLLLQVMGQVLTHYRAAAHG